MQRLKKSKCGGDLELLQFSVDSNQAGFHKATLDLKRRVKTI